MKWFWMMALPLAMTSCDVVGCSKKADRQPNNIKAENDFPNTDPIDDPLVNDFNSTPNGLPTLNISTFRDLRIGVYTERTIDLRNFRPTEHQVVITTKPNWMEFDPAKLSFKGIPEAGDDELEIDFVGQDEQKTVNLSLELTDDPLVFESWHLNNTAQKSFSKSAGSQGVDMNMNGSLEADYTGQGVLIAVSDVAAEGSHEDLNPNHASTLSKNYSLDPPYLGVPPVGSDAHGTAVAGIIAGRGWNNKGSRGIAPYAQFATINFIDSDQTDDIILDQIKGDYDIFNQSWGLNLTSDQTLDVDYRNLLEWNSQNMRRGLGPIYIRAAGNNFSICEEFLCSENASADPFNTTQYTINVAGINADGEHASYSTTGSAVWISAPSGEFGVDAPAIVTTDISGCNKGYAKNSADTNDFDQGDSNLNSECNYTSSFNGTSAAAPMVSGAVALMLEANPKLGWRDVKYILAKTALQVEPDFEPLDIPDLSIHFADGWVTNAGGFSFHNWYGFGLIDTDAAVAMAEDYDNYLGPVEESTNWTTDSWKYRRTGLNSPIPDKSDIGASSTITVTENRPIEAIMVQVDINHNYPNEVMIELTSPSGTKNTILNTFNSFISDPDLNDWITLSNAFYRESAAGTWRIRVYDTLAEDTGTFNSWKLNVITDAP